MRTGLILGASGFLGGVLMACLRRKGVNVVGVGHRHSTGPLHAVDLRDATELRRLLDEICPDWIVNTAAYRDPDFCEENPAEARRLNVQPVKVLAEHLPSATKLVHFSSDYVFDGQHPPYTEKSRRAPLSVYGRTKMESEDYALARKGTLVIRIPVLIGMEPAHRGASGFIVQMMRDIQCGRPREVDDRLVRFPTWTEDVARATLFLLDQGIEGIVHVSSPLGKTRYGWTLDVATLLHRSHDHLRPSRQEVPRKAPRPRNAQLATDLLMALGFGPLSGFDEAARVVISHFARTDPSEC